MKHERARFEDTGSPLTIDRISNHRSSDMGHMDANLMSSSCMESYSDESTGGELSKHKIVGFRVLTSIGFSHDEPFSILWIANDRCLDMTSPFRHDPIYNG